MNQYLIAIDVNTDRPRGQQQVIVDATTRTARRTTVYRNVTRASMHRLTCILDDAWEVLKRIDNVSYPNWSRVYYRRISN